ncbi:MAG: FAD-binding protein [Planctomycetes bacterium]|nr:FAD-binding protein [Planctomycetota bacterium]
MRDEENKIWEWPYPIEYDQTQDTAVDVLVLGGGIAGCWAALGAVSRGLKVAIVEKGATLSSGAGGSGCDHWESAATNPCSKVSPEELTEAMIKVHGGYNNGISHYIECREGWDRLVDLEKMGGKIRDRDDEFAGAEFRDEKTRLLFAYDYENRFTLRVWGTTFKGALYRECKRRGVLIFDRTMATSLLTEGGRQGARVVGAAGIHCRTGKFFVFKAKATILCMSRPTRVWLFSPEMPGISEFRPPQCTGDGHAMGWRAGAAFTMMEKSVKAEWSGLRSFPPYGTGNNHNTWYACSMVDADGKEIPWADRDGKILTSVSQRYRPAQGQKFFIKGGGEPEFDYYQFQGPETLGVEELLKKGYRLPFYADLTAMPEMERKVIWGMMVGEEGKTRIPILANYHKAGFDPEKHLLQSYGDGWKSGAFLPQERQLFGIPGGLVNDWELKTNLEGLYAAGDQLFGSNCHGHAAATGHYAGRHAADYARQAAEPGINDQQVEAERKRVYGPLEINEGMGWKELNASIGRVMQHYCGEVKSEEFLSLGLERLKELMQDAAEKLSAHNPHELMRAIEVLNVLTNAELIIQSCRARKASAKFLHFKRHDYPEMDSPQWHKFITIKQEDSLVKQDELAIDFYGDLNEGYQAHNADYAGVQRT